MNTTKICPKCNSFLNPREYQARLIYACPNSNCDHQEEAYSDYRNDHPPMGSRDGGGSFIGVRLPAQHPLPGQKRKFPLSEHGSVIGTGGSGFQAPQKRPDVSHTSPFWRPMNTPNVGPSSGIRGRSDFSPRPTQATMPTNQGGGVQAPYWTNPVGNWTEYTSVDGYKYYSNGRVSKWEKPQEMVEFERHQEQQYQHVVQLDREVTKPYWDMENTRFPNTHNDSVISLIEAQLEAANCVANGVIKGYAAIPRRVCEFLRASLALQNFELKTKYADDYNGIIPEQVADTLIKDDLDEFLKHVRHYKNMEREGSVEDQIKPCECVLLIAGDRGYAGRLEKLRKEGVKILIMFPAGSTGRELLDQGTICDAFGNLFNGTFVWKPPHLVTPDELNPPSPSPSSLVPVAILGQGGGNQGRYRGKQACRPRSRLDI